MSSRLRSLLLIWMTLGTFVSIVALMMSVFAVFFATETGFDAAAHAAVGTYGGFLLAAVMAPAAAWMAWRRGRQWIAALFMTAPFLILVGLGHTAGAF